MAGWDLVVDCADPDRMVEFWSAALGYERYGAVEQYRSIVDPGGVRPKIVFQRVAEPRPGKNRLHLDLHAEDVEAEAGRLESLGAQRLGVVDDIGLRWIVLADPEGNELCVVPA